MMVQFTQLFQGWLRTVRRASSLSFSSKLQEDDGRGQHDPGQHLDAENDQLQAALQESAQSPPPAPRKTTYVTIEARSLSDGHFQAVRPAFHFTVSPGAGERNGGGAEYRGIDHQ